MTDVVCLPEPGTYNPYQHLMIGGLREGGGLDVTVGLPGRNFALWRSVRTYRPAYLHLDWIHSYYMHRNPVLQLVATLRFVTEVLLIRTTDTKIVWTLHNLYPHRANGRSGWQRRLRSFFARRCAWVRVFDEETAAAARSEFGLPPGQVRVLPEGGYGDFYPNEISRADARRHFGLSADERVIGYVGTIDPYKGVGDLLTAFKNVAPALRRQSRLLVAGGALKTPDYVDRIEKLAAEDERVIFKRGYVADDNLQRYFAAADLVCLPFRRIANSGSTILTMGFGKPIVAPRQGAVANRLEQQDELLYDNQDQLADALTAALQLTDDQLRAIGAANRAALDRHRWRDYQTFFQTN